MRCLAIIFSVFLFNLALSQEFSAIVLDADDQPEVGAQILNINNQKNTVSKKDGLFIIDAKPGDSLKITPIKKETFFYVVPNYLSSDYEIYFINSEDEKVQELQGVTITSNKIKPVVERFNANVVDYIPFKNGRLLTACSLRNKYTLYIEANDEVIEKFEVDRKRIKELFIDAFGNYHLVCKDSIYQFVLSEKLIELNAVSTAIFNDNIKNIVYNDSERLVVSIFSNHNKAFRLIKRSRKIGRDTIVHTRFDLEAFKKAKAFYHHIIDLYHAAVPYELNVIKNGVWNGELDQLAARDDGSLIQAIMWYKNVVGRKIDVHAFPYKDGIIIFDFDIGTIETLDYNADLINQIHISESSKMDRFEMLHDTITDNYFCYDPSSATLELYQIDLTTGELLPCLTLDGVRYPKKPKVFNGWLYFIDLNDASFNKLYRAKLDD